MQHNFYYEDPGVVREVAANLLNWRISDRPYNWRVEERLLQTIRVLLVALVLIAVVGFAVEWAYFGTTCRFPDRLDTEACQALAATYENPPFVFGAEQ